MSKILDATCDASSVVTSDGVSVPVAQILSEGKQASEGVLVLEGLKAYYITSNATDIKSLIESLVGIINQISVIVSGMDAVTTTPGSNAAAITQLGVLKTQLDATKDLLK